MATEKMTPFKVLSTINCNDRTEQKNGLTYLSWAWAWYICKKHFPTAFYTIYENPDGRPYFDDGRTAWVKTGVTIEGLEHVEYLPVMNHMNQSIPLARITSTDMNKSIQRSLTKAIARHGLGLYIYAGEDIPDALDEDARAAVNDEIAGKRAPVKPEQKPDQKKKEKRPLPVKGSEEWDKWVNAIVTGWTNKTGQPAMTVFALTYEASADAMKAAIDEMELEAFNRKMDGNNQN